MMRVKRLLLKFYSLKFINDKCVKLNNDCKFRLFQIIYLLMNIYVRIKMI